MADVLMLVTRESGYWRGGRHYPPGSSLTVPESAARAMEAANPPFGRRITDEELAALTEPAVDATPGAIALAEERGIDLRFYAGRGSGRGGRITQRDVEEWTASSTPPSE